jgi:hypothetical protein
MSKIKNLALIFALSIAAIGFYLYVAYDSKSPSTTSSVEVYQPQQQTKSESTTEVQPAATVEDPFKKFLEEKSSNQNSSAKAENTQPSPVQPGKDPFKEFLEKQKQNSKDQVVSPFGKN